MSVINDMLRDLDQRSGSQGAAVPVGGGGPPRRSGWRWLGVGLLLLALAALAVAVAVRFGGWQPVAMVSAWRVDGAGAQGAAEGTDGSDDAAGNESGGSSDASTNTVATEEATGSGDGEPSGDSRARTSDGDLDSATANKSANELTLTSLASERGEKALELTATVAGGTVGADHRRTEQGGVIRFPNVALGQGLSVPAAGGDGLRGVTVGPSGEGVVLRYRTDEGARVRLQEERRGDEQEYSLTVRLPDSGDDAGAVAQAQAGTAANDAQADSEPPERESTASAEAGQRSRPTTEPTTPSREGEGQALSSGVMGAEEATSGGADAADDVEASAAGEGSDSGSRISRQRRGPKPGARAEAAYRDALSAFQADDKKAGRQALDAALEADPGHAGARRALTMLHLRQGEPEQAGRVLREGFDRGTRTPTLIALYARSWAQRGDNDKAVAIMEQGRETVSVDGQYLATLAALYQQQGRYEAAAQAYRQALERNRASAAWWAGFGIALEDSGDAARAKKAYQQALNRGGMSDSLAGYVRQRLDALE